MIQHVQAGVSRSVSNLGGAGSIHAVLGLTTAEVNLHIQAALHVSTICSLPLSTWPILAHIYSLPCLCSSAVMYRPACSVSRFGNATLLTVYKVNTELDQVITPSPPFLPFCNVKPKYCIV